MDFKVLLGNARLALDNLAYYADTFENLQVQKHMQNLVDVHDVTTKLKCEELKLSSAMKENQGLKATIVLLENKLKETQKELKTLLTVKRHSTLRRNVSSESYEGDIVCDFGNDSTLDDQYLEMVY
jgi:hypothetical protein